MNVTCEYLSKNNERIVCFSEPDVQPPTHHNIFDPGSRAETVSSNSSQIYLENFF